MVLDCDWGRIVSTEDDLEQCPRRCTNQMVIHSGDSEITLRVCELHFVRLLRETDPHKEEATA